MSDQKRLCKRKYVLTGGPGVGKSALIRLLHKRGYGIVHEIGREVIEEQKRSNGNLLPWIDRDGFQREILRRRLIEEFTVSGEVVFLDRGIPDGLAYYKLDGITPPEELIAISKQYRYSGVFLLDPLKDYCCDSVRYHSHKESKRIHQLLLEVYTDLGYRIKIVPSVPIEQRADWILSNL